MLKDFNQVLDLCLDRLNRGEKIEDCLKDYPEYSQQLEPLLRSAVQTKSAFSFSPSEDAKRLGRQRLYAAIEKKSRPVPPFYQRRSFWTVVAGAAVIAIALFFILNAVVLNDSEPGSRIAQPGETAPNPGETAADYIAGANPAGNFAFLVSDDLNAVADFSNIYVTLSRIGILQSGPAGRWQEFTPEVRQFDLALLPGEKTLEIWRGNVPEGEYMKAVIYVSDVYGILKTGETVTIKLPSNKLQIPLNFKVASDSLTSLVYDLTVIDTGKGKNGDKYLLKPQISESGVGQRPLLK